MSFLTLENRTEWERARQTLRAFGAGDIYFSPDYHALYANPEQKAEAFIYEDGENLFFFPYMRRELTQNEESSYDLESAYGYGGPISNCTNKGFLNRAWRHFIEAARKSHLFAGFIRFHPLLDNHGLADELEGVKVCRLRQTVKLTLGKTAEQIWNGYHPNTRNKIEKARKNNVQIQYVKTLDGLLEFARHYRLRMQALEAGEFYFFNDAYFEKIHQLFETNYGLFLASHDNRTVGGVLVLLSDDYAHLHLSAVGAESQKLGVPSLLRHEAICHYLREKQVFHFGGGNTNAEDDSVFKFKCGFSNERDDFWIGKLLINEPEYQRVCAQWESAHPEKATLHNNIFLKYRM